jgi:hypothetical protein
MSYCRAGEDSDVYVYPSGNGIVCCSCPMIGEDLAVTSALNMLTHLQGHMSRGDKVPRAALERLLREAGFLGDAPLTCPNCCCTASVETTAVVQCFTYGLGAAAVELSADVLVHRCTSCGEEYTDAYGEIARDAAVRKHLAGGT